MRDKLSDEREKAFLPWAAAIAFFILGLHSLELGAKNFACGFCFSSAIIVFCFKLVPWFFKKDYISLLSKMTNKWRGGGKNKKTKKGK